jgi:hypothetical protein
MTLPGERLSRSCGGVELGVHLVHIRLFAGDLAPGDLLVIVGHR